MMAKTIFWHRRDLRINDNRGLYEALKAETSVQPIFIFDKNILDDLPQDDPRVSFIYDTLQGLKEEYKKVGGDLKVYHGYPEDVFKEIILKDEVAAVFTNCDYEPYALERDQKINQILDEKGVLFKTFKDHVIFEKDEVLKDDGDPYVVYTPYMRKWKANFSNQQLSAFESEKKLKSICQVESEEIPSLERMNFKHVDYESGRSEISKELIKKYQETRDLPYVEGTSRKSVHLRFGTISIREIMRETKDISEKYWNELIWRDFYQMILWHFPETTNQSFRKEYDQIPWKNGHQEFEAWKKGKTGYPIVDAGMRELNQTGYMHNRVRMIVSSFLTKHLLIDWRWGEAYFAEKLMDYEMASNIGGWQWAAGCGVDAAPYFRVFNPSLQQKKFDPELKYIRKWVEDFDELTYPQPIVEHKAARERAIDTYKKALS